MATVKTTGSFDIIDMTNPSIQAIKITSAMLAAGVKVLRDGWDETFYVVSDLSLEEIAKEVYWAMAQIDQLKPCVRK